METKRHKLALVKMYALRRSLHDIKNRKNKKCTNRRNDEKKANHIIWS